MFLADYHTHSRCSPDGQVPLRDMAAAALEAGLGELCLTDHCDLLDFDGHPDRSFRWAPIEAEFSDARPRFHDKLTLKMGLELGEIWEDPAWAKKLTSHPDLDFVIASVHNLGSDRGGGDIYFFKYKNEDDCADVFSACLDYTEKLLALDGWDVLGHIIYPLRYMNGRDGNHLTLERFYPRLEAIFKKVAAREKGIEVNTCRGTTVEDWREVLALYKDCGGELVTLGSDAHHPRDVAAGLPEAAKLLKSFGFKLATYTHHIPQLHEL